MKLNLRDTVTPDGTDQSVAIQAAIIAAQGHRLLVNDGVYYAANLQGVDGLELEDDGGILKLWPSTNGSILLFFGKKNFKVSTRMDGNRAANSGNPSGHWLVVQGSEHFEITDCLFTDARGGVIVQNYNGAQSSHGLIEKNRIIGSGSHGFSLADSYKLRVVANDVDDVAYSSINFSACFHSTVIGNCVANPAPLTHGFGGIRLSNGCSFNTVSANAALRTSIGVFILSGSQYNTINANTVDLAGLQGILDQVGSNAITGNVVVNPGECSVASTMSGIQLDGAAFTALSGNVIRDTRNPHRMEYGIRFTGDYGGAVPTGNVVTGSVYG